MRLEPSSPAEAAIASRSARTAGLSPPRCNRSHFTNEEGETALPPPRRVVCLERGAFNDFMPREHIGPLSGPFARPRDEVDMCHSSYASASSCLTCSSATIDPRACAARSAAFDAGGGSAAHARNRPSPRAGAVFAYAPTLAFA